MAPNVSLYFYPANDLNGSPLHVITDEDEYFKSLKLKLDLYGLGGAELVLARKVGFAGFTSGTFGTEVFVRVLVHAYSDTEFFTGFFLEKRQQVVIDVDEDGGEEFHFGGPGPKAYLDRARTRPETFTDSDWHLDLQNGVWRWKITATWTGVMRRLLLEDQAADAPALSDLTWDFTFNDDSAGDPSDEVGGADEYEIPIGRTYTEALWDLEDADFGVSTISLGTVASPEFELHLWNSYGTDVHSSTFASGKALLREGVNITNDSLELDGVALRKCTHVIVEGKNATWVTVEKPSWDPGEYVKLGKIEYTRSSKESVLNRVGLRWLRRQDNGDQEITVNFLPGHSDAAGLYFPNDGPLTLGNLVSVDTTADGAFHTPLDLQPSELQLVTGFEMELLEASRTDTALQSDRSWNCKVKLNYERGGNSQSPNQTTVYEGSCLCPTHPDTGTPGTPPTAPTEDYRWSFTDRGGAAADNLLDDGTSTIYWFSPNWDDGIGASAWHADYDAHMTWGHSGAVTQHVTPTTPGIPVTAGELYTFDADMSQREADSSAWLRVEWYAVGGTQLQIDYIAGPGVSVAAKAHYSKVITAPATATFIRLRVDAATGEFGAADNIVISHGGSGGTAGTPSTAPVTTVGGTGTGTYSGSTSYVPIGSQLELVYIDSGGPYIYAGGISYDASTSGLSADDIQAAVDELAALVAAGTASLEVAETDGAPDVADVGRIEFDGPTVIDDGGGQVTVQAANLVHAHDAPTVGIHKLLVKRTTNFTGSASNDSIPDFDTIIEDTMSAPWWSSGDADRLIVTADYDGLDAIFTAKFAVADPGSQQYLEGKLYLFPASYGEPRPIGILSDDYLLSVEQQPATDNINHFIRIVSDPVTVHTGDQIMVALRTVSGTMTYITYNGRVSITLGAYIASNPGPAGATGADGEGVPTGGTVGQVLTKDSSTDFDTSWQDPTGSDAVWHPVMAQDPGGAETGRWWVVVDGDGTAVMAEG